MEQYFKNINAWLNNTYHWNILIKQSAPPVATNPRDWWQHTVWTASEYLCLWTYSTIVIKSSTCFRNVTDCSWRQVRLLMDQYLREPSCPAREFLILNGGKKQGDLPPDTKYKPASSKAILVTASWWATIVCTHFPVAVSYQILVDHLTTNRFVGHRILLNCLDVQQ